MGWVEDEIFGISFIDEPILKVWNRLFQFIGVGVDINRGD